MDKVSKSGQMEAATRANIMKELKMGLDLIDGLMVPSTLVIGLTMKFTGSGITNGWTADST